MNPRCALTLAGLEVIVQALQAFREDHSWKTSPDLFPKLRELAQAQRDTAAATQDRLEEWLMQPELMELLEAPQLELPKERPGTAVALVLSIEPPAGVAHAPPSD